MRHKRKPQSNDTHKQYDMCYLIAVYKSTDEANLETHVNVNSCQLKTEKTLMPCVVSLQLFMYIHFNSQTVVFNVLFRSSEVLRMGQFLLFIGCC